MTINRDLIISTIRNFLEPDPNVLAVWLEGAGATGNVDEFSDIDLCCSVRAGAMDAATERAQKALESLGRLDIIEQSSREEDTQATAFHLAGTSSYLLVDFNVYVGRGSRFTLGDPIEKPLVLFDRAGVVEFARPDEAQITRERASRLAELSAVAAQDSRIIKYVRRGDFLEAFGYYHRWLLAPLIEVLRMRYTPLHPDYYIVHISRHLPADVLRRLEDLFKICSLADIETKSREARAFFEETAAFLREEE